jgi:predicted acylesterase/phospholipase RssA
VENDFITPSTTSFTEVLQAEWNDIKVGRVGIAATGMLTDNTSGANSTSQGGDTLPSSPAPDPPPQDLAGLAFSGGGICSATFNLGVIQALAELRILRKFDYLSTVSGGGYIGS